MQTHRKRDHKGEQIVHQFLCNFFYPLLFENKEVTNKEEQISGIDEKCLIDNKWCSIDEKTQLTRLNQDINQYTTQCLEIVSKNRDGAYKAGWIENVATDYYLFTYVTKCSTDNPNTLSDVSQIKKVRAVLISKKEIENLLKNNGLTIDSLKSHAKEMLNGAANKETNTHKYIYFDNSKDVWLCLSKSNFLAETPINAVIRWSQYEKYAWHVYDITQNYVQILK